MALDESGRTVRLEVKPDKVISDGKSEVTVRCVVAEHSKKPPKEETSAVFVVKKQKIREERQLHKGSATFKFKPGRPTGKTLIECSTPIGDATAWVRIDPTPYQYIRDTVQAILLAFILAFGIIRPFIIQTYYIPSGSMEPTLYEKDRLIALMFTYRFRDPRPGEIVIFSKPDACKTYKIPLVFKTVPIKTCTKFIKRVVAVEGETLEVRDMTVYVNGKPLDEPFIKEPPMRNYGPLKVPKGTLFMMGDNRNNSNDSTFWGPLERKYVVSKSLFRFWPLDRIGTIPQPERAYK